MKRQNITKITTAMLFAVTPFVLSANPEKVKAKSIVEVGTADLGNVEKINEKILEINEKWKLYLDKLNFLLSSYIREYQGIVVMDSDGFTQHGWDGFRQYKEDIKAVEGEIRRIRSTMDAVEGAKKKEFQNLFPGISNEKVAAYNEQLKVRFSKVNTQRLRILIESLKNLPHLSKRTREYLLTKVSFINELYEAKGTPLTSKEVEAVSKALGKINDQNAWNELLKKRIRGFLGVALIDCANYETGIQSGTGARYIRGVRDFEYSAFITVATMRKLQLTIDEKEFQEDLDKVRAWLCERGLSESQKLHMNLFYSFLLSLIRNGKKVEFPRIPYLTEGELSRQEIYFYFDQLFHQAGENFLRHLIIGDSVSGQFCEDSYRLFNVLDKAKRNGIRIQGSIILEFLHKCRELFGFIGMQKSMRSSCEIEFLKYAVWNCLYTFPRECFFDNQKQRLDDVFKEVMDLYLPFESNMREKHL